MHITALCPFCRSAYQVQETLRGQLVRCPNASCRKIFPVPAEAPATDAPAAPKPPSSHPSPGTSQRAGTVGDLVPMLPAEPAAPPPESETRPAEGDWWQSAPPVREKPAQPAAHPPTAPASGPPTADAAWWRDAPPVRQPQKPAAPAPAPAQVSTAPTQRLRSPARPLGETQPMPALEPEKSEEPRELPPGAWEPPPVRRGQESEEQAPQPAEETPESEVHRPPVSTRRAWLAIGFAGFLAVFLLGGGALFVISKIRMSEEALSKEASTDYKQGLFGPAKEKFRDVERRFPKSVRTAEYHFMADWCDACRAASNPAADLDAAAQFAQFIEDHKKDPFMRELAHGAGQRLLDLTKTLTAHNANPTDEQPLKVVDRIEKLRRTITALSPDALTRNEQKQIDDNINKVRRAVELALKRRKVLDQVAMQGEEKPFDALRRARSLLARMERELPGITAEAQPALAKLEEAHLASVVYRRAEDVPPLPAPALPVDDGETMLFAPLMSSELVGNAPLNDPIVLALVNGVLYALKQSTGDLKWAERVGIDTTVLPLRVPASAFTPELLLVISADTQTLSALNVEGDSLWDYHVGQPVLGKPVLIEQRAYLADYSGWVHEIELSRGQLLGRWFLGQPLTRGGTREGETSRIYFPADDSCIYVLDVNPQAPRCVTILYDDHPSGSLRSEPVIIPPEGDAAGFLILNQTNGLDRMGLRVFELPLQDRHAAPLTLNPPAQLAGWTWFEPKQDGEKLAILSDAGTLGLFGIKQVGNKDPALFPMLAPGGLDLSPFLNPPAAPAKRQQTSHERGRSQVVYMQDKDLWLLAHGGFQQVQLGWKYARGPQATSVWEKPLRLGSPLHDPQRREDRNGRSTFFLVTQALQQQTCLATAVDELGKTLWQRQLGLICQGEPLPMTPPGGGPPVLLALDRGGGLFVLDPQLPLDKLRYIRHALAPALEENPLVPPRLLLATDGRSAYEIAAPGDGHKLIVRHIEWVNGQRELRVSERSPVSLGDPSKSVPTLACPPVVAGSQLLLAMTDGRIKRLPLTDDKSELDTGPSWYDMRSPVIPPCHVLALGGDRFLTTFGNRSLYVYEWPLGMEASFEQLPKGGQSLKPLEHFVAAAPVLLPAEDGSTRFAVVDSAGILRLFVVKADGSLQAGRTWTLDGNLTAGPFVQADPEGGWRIGCVLDRNRLRWIDPAKPEPLWTYSSDGPAILGPPQQIEKMLVVALQSGKYVGIDPKTGKPNGRGYTLRTSAAPAATPMPFGPGRMFAPLSDGTALLLSVELLRRR